MTGKRWACVIGMWLCASCGGESESSNTSSRATSSATTTASATSTPPPILPQVCTGDEHTCVMKASGEVFCAGRNLDGQLGDGTAQSRSAWTPVVGLTDARALACGQSHTCAVRRSGEVSCWGKNEHGELGAGHTDVTHVPVAVSGLANVAQIDAGAGFTCARQESGAVWCWGTGANGRLGTGTNEDKSAPAALTGLTDAAEIALGRAHACARKNDGSVVCWGASSAWQTGLGEENRRDVTSPTVVPNVSATAIAAGGNHTCAITNGGATCWGQNDAGQIGNGEGGSQVYAKTPVVVPGLTGVTQLALGARRTCAIVGAGEVKCWGYNNYTAELLGVGSQEGNVLTPSTVRGVTGAARMDTGDDHACAFDAAGALYCWGSAGEGRLGNGSSARLAAASAVVPNVAALTGTASVMPTFAPSEGASLPIQPGLSIGSNEVCGVKPDGRVLCFGENLGGRLGIGSTRANASDSETHVLGISDAVQVATGLGRSCALRRDGSVACWGRLGPELEVSHPIPMGGFVGATSIAVGGSASAMVLCARLQDATLVCAGENYGGQLGRGHRGDFTLEPAPVAGLTDVAQVRIGVDAACARLTSGKVTCWGSGSRGQLGNGATDASPSPVEVSGIRDASELGGGSYTFCALRRGGAPSCWGSNDDGQLANGKSGREHDSSTPVAVRNVRGVARLGDTTDSICVALGNGEGRCWGANDFGQTGSGDTETDDVLAPVKYERADAAVQALGDVVQMGCGWNFCCALHAQGGVSCAGSTPIGGSGGIFGISNRRSATPIAAPGLTFAVPD